MLSFNEFKAIFFDGNAKLKNTPDQPFGADGPAV